MRANAVSSKQVSYIFASQSPVKRMPKVRRSNDRIVCVRYDYWGEYRVAVLDELRGAAQGREFQIWDQTIMVTEFPFALRTIDTSVCLAAAFLDIERLVVGICHLPFAEKFEEAADFSLWAMNSARRNVHVGLSGMIFSRGDEARRQVAQTAAKYGRVVYNVLGQRGDIAVSTSNRLFFYPHG